MNGATCVPKYEGNDYHCACPLGNYGKDCEDKGIINLRGV